MRQCRQPPVQAKIALLTTTLAVRRSSKSQRSRAYCRDAQLGMNSLITSLMEIYTGHTGLLPRLVMGCTLELPGQTHVLASSASVSVARARGATRSSHRACPEFAQLAQGLTPLPSQTSTHGKTASAVWLLAGQGRLSLRYTRVPCHLCSWTATVAIFWRLRSNTQ